MQVTHPLAGLAAARLLRARVSLLEPAEGPRDVILRPASRGASTQRRIVARRRRCCSSSTAGSELALNWRPCSELAAAGPLAEILRPSGVSMTRACETAGASAALNPAIGSPPVQRRRSRAAVQERRQQKSDPLGSPFIGLKPLCFSGRPSRRRGARSGQGNHPVRGRRSHRGRQPGRRPACHRRAARSA